MSPTKTKPPTNKLADKRFVLTGKFPQQDGPILLSGKEREDRLENLRFFIGGLSVTSITLFTLFVSTIYNDAIATSEFCF